VVLVAFGWFVVSQMVALARGARHAS
jgi:hypothetical protein